MDWIMSDFPALHCLPEFAQTHVHWVCDAIQPPHPLLPPSPLPSFFSEGWLFASNGWSIEASTLASVLLMNIHNWVPLRLTGLISLLSKGLSRVFSSTTIQFSLVQSLSCVWLFVTAWTTAYKASLSITNLQSLLKLHWIDDAIQSLPLLLSPSPPAFNLSQHQDLF